MEQQRVVLHHGGTRLRRRDASPHILGDSSPRDLYLSRKATRFWHRAPRIQTPEHDLRYPGYRAAVVWVVRVQWWLCFVCQLEGCAGLHCDKFSSERWWTDLDALGEFIFLRSSRTYNADWSACRITVSKGSGARLDSVRVLSRGSSPLLQHQVSSAPVSLYSPRPTIFLLLISFITSRGGSVRRRCRNGVQFCHTT
jgi:hypothetical protein